jgi:Protein of unknown function (DUF2851)
MAPECFIQFIWRHRLFSAKSLRTTCDLELEILNPGEQNVHAGPDFYNARIRLGTMVWAGNVEIHRYASDWYKHGHHLDPAYNNVILHVVGKYDTDVTNTLGRRIHTLIPEYHENVLRRFDVLKRNDSWLPCSEYINMVPKQKLLSWFSTLYKERLAQKCLRIEQLLCISKKYFNDEILYLALASGYGLPINNIPFELLARGIPLHNLADLCDTLFDLEAILYGQSGLLLPAKEMGPYPQALWDRFTELKYSLKERPLPPHLWRFLRLRPPSFPTLRISQFASCFHHCFPLASKILDSDTLAEIEQLFRSPASEYWNTHYVFGKSSPPLTKYPGEQFLTTLMINVIIPYLFSLEKKSRLSKAGIHASEILFQLKAESNQLIKNWGIFGIRPRNAMESQALLQLYHVYCKQKRCLECQIGAEIVKTASRE